jgi:hypothetical protein
MQGHENAAQFGDREKARHELPRVFEGPQNHVAWRYVEALLQPLARAIDLPDQLSVSDSLRSVHNCQTFRVVFGKGSQPLGDHSL